VGTFVKSLTAVGKSLIILISSVLFLSACGTTSNTNSRSTYASTNADYSSPSSSIVVAMNYLKWSTHKMTAWDQKQQEQAVFFALNNLKAGEVTNWYNGNTGARGQVRVAMSYPQGSGYCRVLQSEIYYNGKDRNFQETACINAVDNTWRFVR